METKTCKVCQKDQPLSEFYRKQKDQYRADCKNCHKKYVSQHNAKNREFINNLKTQGQCEKCGETRHYVLDYHHLNPNDKKNTIARQMVHASQENTLNEIKKCTLLCANCHREFHFLNQKDGLTLSEYIAL